MPNTDEHCNSCNSRSPLFTDRSNDPQLDAKPVQQGSLPDDRESCFRSNLRKERGAVSTMTHHQCWNVCGLKESTRPTEAKGKPLLPAQTQRPFETKGIAHSQRAQGVHTATKFGNEGYQQACSVFKDLSYVPPYLYFLPPHTREDAVRETKELQGVNADRKTSSSPEATTRLILSCRGWPSGPPPTPVTTRMETRELPPPPSSHSEQ